MNDNQNPYANPYGSPQQNRTTVDYGDTMGNPGQTYEVPGQTYETYNQTSSSPDWVYGGPAHNQSTAGNYDANTNYSYEANGAVSSGGSGNSTNGSKQGLSPRLKTFGVAFLGALLACVVAIGGSQLLGVGSNTVTIGGSGSGSTITVSGDDATLAEVVAAKDAHSVATVTTYVKQSTQGNRFTGTSSSSSLTEYGSGSGVVISSDGYILTNYHVIEDTDKVTVNLDAKDYDATVVGSDQSSDLAVLKIDATGLSSIEIGSSESLVVGQWCMAIGSAFGLDTSVSQGIVSATNCNYSELNESSSSSGSSSSSTGSSIYTNMIQTDTAVNPGNSGGALVDKDGKLIGITTMGMTYSGDNSGVNFAIPVDYAIDIAQQIISGKTPSHAQLGVTMATVNSTNAAQYDLPVTSGAYVNSVSSGSSAANAGIQQGDIIVAVNGEKVTSATDAILAIRSHKAGDTISITVNRSGSEQTMNVTLGSDN